MEKYQDPKWLEEKYQELGTLDAVAGIAGVSDETIRRWMDEYKLHRVKHEPLSQEVQQKLKSRQWLESQYTKYGSVQKIARLLGVSGPTVWRWMDKHNIYRIAPKHEPQISSAGYRLIYKPDFPGTTKHGYALEHRVIMSEHLGRDLEPNEHVHHINGNKSDNRLENLVLLSQEEHRTHHNGFYSPTMTQAEKIKLMRAKGMLAGEIGNVVGLCNITVGRYLEQNVPPICGICGRKFKNQKGVSVHVNRTHRMRY